MALTVEQEKIRSKYEHKLTYGRGIFTSQWDELKELRTLWLEAKGLNPNDYNLDSRNITKK